jgi:hypothetical protein
MNSFLFLPMKYASFVLSLSIFLLPASSSAAVFQKGDTVEVQAQDNAYAAGKVVNISSEARGDVYLLGETVQINAPLRGDAMIAGQNIAINGGVGEDLHAAGRTLLLNEAVRGDAMILGQEVVTSPKVRVAGTTLIAGSNIVTEGRFEKDVKIFGETVALGGTYNGNVEVHASEVTVGEKVAIRGNLVLSTPEGTTVTVPEEAVRGTVERKILPGGHEKNESFFAGLHMFFLLSTILIGSLVILFLRPFALRFGADVRKNYGKMLGAGFLTLTVPPLLAFFLLLPILTIPFSLFVLALWAVTLYMGKVLAGLIFAQLLMPFSKEHSTWRMIGVFALMTVLISFLTFIPVVGFLICFVLFLLSLGSIVLYKGSTFKVLRKAGMI